MNWIVGEQPGLPGSRWFDCAAALRTVDALAAAAREAADIPQSLHDDLAAMRERPKTAVTNSARFHLRIGTSRQADATSMDRHF